MKITALQEYGIRVLLQLAELKSSHGPVQVGTIAEREAISTDYVQKILTRLKKSGLVRSERGLKGGYLLVHSPEKVSVGEAMMALTKRPIQLNHLKKDLCTQFPGDRTKCIHLGGCTVRQLWSMVIAQLYGILNRIYLSDLLGTESVVQNRLVKFIEMHKPTSLSLN